VPLKYSSPSSRFNGSDCIVSLSTFLFVFSILHDLEPEYSYTPFNTTPCSDDVLMLFTLGFMNKINDAMNIIRETDPNFEHSTKMRRGFYDMISCYKFFERKSFQQSNQFLMSSSRKWTTTQKMNQSPSTFQYFK
jgi:hypothetical protein